MPLGLQICSAPPLMISWTCLIVTRFRGGQQGPVILLPDSRESIWLHSLMPGCSPVPGDWRPLPAPKGAGMGHTTHLGSCWQLRVSGRQGMLPQLMLLPIHHTSNSSRGHIPPAVSPMQSPCGPCSSGLSSSLLTMLLLLQLHFPGALAMILSGILLRNINGGIIISGLRPSWSKQIRAAALAIIFLRSGLEIDLDVSSPSSHLHSVLTFCLHCSVLLACQSTLYRTQASLSVTSSCAHMAALSLSVATQHKALPR